MSKHQAREEPEQTGRSPPPRRTNLQAERPQPSAITRLSQPNQEPGPETLEPFFCYKEIVSFSHALQVAAVAAGLSACTPVNPTSIDHRLTLAVGQTASVQDASLRLTFQAVTGDSRCPADAICIQGGDAVVHIEVQSSIGGSVVAYDLHTGNMKPVQHTSFTIALVELTPYPFSSRPVQPNEYRATFRITR